MKLLQERSREEFINMIIMTMAFAIWLVFIALIFRLILNILGSVFRLSVFLFPAYILYRLFHRNRYYY